MWWILAKQQSFSSFLCVFGSSGGALVVMKLCALRSVKTLQRSFTHVGVLEQRCGVLHDRILSCWELEFIFGSGRGLAPSQQRSVQPHF